MSIKVTIGDGFGKNGEVKVLDNSSLLITPTAYPALENSGQPSRLQFLSGYLGTTGLDTGITNANVNGSVTNQEFYVTSEQEFDIRIMKILIYIQDGTVTHSGFGSLATLTNGIDIIVTEGGLDTYIIRSGKNFANLIEQTLAAASFGDAATAFELSDVQGTEDAQVLPFNLGEIMPYGLRLGRGTTDKIRLVVRDNLTGLTRFNVRIIGYRHYPPVRHKD